MNDLNGIEHSFLSTAFLQVKENHGCAGVDGVTVEGFDAELGVNIARLAYELRTGSYSPLPLLKILVDKGNGEARALCVPTVRDRVAQTAVFYEIEPVLEKEFEDCSFAFRKGRSVRLAVSRIRQYYDEGYRWVVDADIDAFFDSVNHDILLEKVKRYIRDEGLVRLITAWVKAEVWDGDSLKVMEKGIPQGSVISPILANLFLDELDEEMLKMGTKYVRYADDFLILAKSPEKAREALEITVEILRRLDLCLDEAEVVSFDQGFTYLGVTFMRSLVMVPFETTMKERKVLYKPPPLNMDAYLLKKRRGW